MKRSKLLYENKFATLDNFMGLLPILLIVEARSVYSLGFFPVDIANNTLGV